MFDKRLWVAGAVVVLLAAAGGGFLLGRMNGGGTVPPAPSGVSPERKPLYYQDPDGKPIYSASPKKNADGRDFKPIYQTGANASPAPSEVPKRRGRILYYRNPMGLADISRVPRKDPMGMDYIPIHQGEEETGVVEVSPARLQMLGVTTAPVTVRSELARTVRATGVVEADESKLAAVTTKFDGVVEKLFISTTGAEVRAGQPLARVWIQTPDTTMQIGPDVITRQIDYVIALQEKNSVAIAQAARVLRQYGMPASALAEIRRTGRATRSVTIVAPRSGVVLDKPAIEGMHFNTGDPLFKIADLSTVWLIADVAEQDSGALRVGETAHVSFVAYPGREFMGRVEFVYPMLMQTTRTGRVRIVLQNPNGALRGSMYATVTIDTAAAAEKPILVVPDSAIIDSGARQAVLVEKGPGRFAPRAVRIGARGDGYAEVLSGLKPGERVVTGANFLIDAESNLRAALQAFTPGGAKDTQAGMPQ
jgi:Cu(I)/Ag(I) efflux system membrane fusion protein